MRYFHINRSPDGDGGGSLSATLPALGAGTGAAPSAPELSTLIPKDYAERPWVKETKDVPSLFKRMDDLITERGKRPAGIPAADAPPEAWAAFNKAMGVPEKADGYKLPEVEGADPELMTGIREAFHKAGLSPRQAEAFQKEWTALATKLADKMAPEDVKFDELAKTHFGDREAAVMEQAKSLIAAHVPEGMKGLVPNLPADSLVVLAAVLDDIAQKYIGEGRIPRGGSSAGGAAGGLQALRAEGQKLQASEAFKNEWHPDHAATRARLDAIYEQVAKLTPA